MKRLLLPVAAIIAAIMCGCGGGGGSALSYSVINLGSLGGTARVFGISSCSLVVGDYGEEGAKRAYFWDPVTSTMKDIGILPGADQMSASAANGNGLVAGVASLSAGGTVGFTWRDANGNGTADPSELQQLPSLGGSSLVFDINDAGTIVGSSDSAGVTYPVKWVNNAVTKLSTTPGTAYAVNQSGTAVGEVNPGGSSVKHAAVFKNGATIDLGTFGGTNSVAKDINDSGVVVGYAQSSSGQFHAFRWQDKNGNNVNDPGEMEDLGTLGGPASFAQGINNAGDIVGSSDTTSDTSVPPHAFILKGGRMTDVNSAVSPGSGIVVNRALGVNDAGQIILSGFSGPTQASFLAVVGSSDFNRCPVIISIKNTFHEDSHSNIFDITATDPDDDALNFKWTINGPVLGCGTDRGSPGGPSTKEVGHLGCQRVVEDASSVTVEISDGRGGVVKYTHPLRSEGTFNRP